MSRHGVTNTLRNKHWVYIDCQISYTWLVQLLLRSFNPHKTLILAKPVWFFCVHMHIFIFFLVHVHRHPESLQSHYSCTELICSLSKCFVKLCYLYTAVSIFGFLGGFGGGLQSAVHVVFVLTYTLLLTVASTAACEQTFVVKTLTGWSAFIFLLISSLFCIYASRDWISCFFILKHERSVYPQVPLLICAPPFVRSPNRLIQTTLVPLEQMSKL